VTSFVAKNDVGCVIRTRRMLKAGVCRQKSAIAAGACDWRYRWRQRRETPSNVDGRLRLEHRRGSTQDTRCRYTRTVLHRPPRHETAISQLYTTDNCTSIYTAHDVEPEPSLLTLTRVKRSSASVCVCRSVCLSAHDRTKTAKTATTKLATGIVYHES